MPIVAIVGFGAMGSGLAQLFAQKNFEVRAADTNEDAIKRGMDSILNGRFGLARMVKSGKLEESESREILNKIQATVEAERAVTGAKLVVENVDENLELKESVFKKLDSLCDRDTILATDTSSLSVTSIASKTKYPERIAGLHFFIPPQVMPLVEIIGGLMTSKETIEDLRLISDKLEKTVVVSKDRPGFVVARLGLRQFLEASAIVEEGIATVKDVDVGAKKGLGHPMGPFELTDLIGLDTRLEILEAMFGATGNPSWKPPTLLRQLVESGYKGSPDLKKGSKGGFYEYFGISEHQ